MGYKQFMENIYGDNLIFADGELIKLRDCILIAFHPTALKGCQGIVFTHGVQMGGRAVGKSLSGLYLRNRKV